MVADDIFKGVEEGVSFNKIVGSITSRCSVTEPALLDGWTPGLNIVNSDQQEI